MKSYCVVFAIAIFLCLSLQAHAQTNYEYDALGRLIEVERVGAEKKNTYSYDDAGNRQSVVQETYVGEFSVSDANVLEGGILTFTVTRGGGDAYSHDVTYSTSTGSADGNDYTAVSNGTLIFAPSDTSKTVTIQTTADSIFEGVETFTLNLISATNGGIISGSQGIGTIDDASPAPVFSISDDTKTEGQNLTFTVTKTGSTALTHTVVYSTADDSATAPSDYIAQQSITLSFAHDELSKTITIIGEQDSAVEGTQSFHVNLSNPTGGAVISATNGVGTGTITDDDTVSPDDIVLTLVDPATQSIVKVLSATDSIALSELSTADYALRVDYLGSASVGSVQFLENGVQVKNENMAPYSRFGDGAPHNSNLYGGPLPASALTIKIEVRSAIHGGGSLLDEKTYSIGIGTIPPVFTINDQDVTEDVGNAVFTVTLTDATTLTHTVEYATSGDTALPGSDYTTTSGTLTFTPGGSTTQPISVPILDDAIVEGVKSFHVNLSNATGGNVEITDPLGVGTITDDDVVTNDITLTLVDPVTQEHLRVLSLSDTISASELSSGDYALRVDYQGTASVGSVLFTENSVLVKTENVAPYSRFGDTQQGAVLTGRPLPTSAITLKVEVWSAAAGAGTLLEEATYSLGVN